MSSSFASLLIPVTWEGKRHLTCWIAIQHVHENKGSASLDETAHLLRGFTTVLSFIGLVAFNCGRHYLHLPAHRLGRLYKKEIISTTLEFPTNYKLQCF